MKRNYLTVIMLTMALTMPTINASAQYNGHRGGTTSTTGTTEGRRPGSNSTTTNRNTNRPNNSSIGNPSKNNDRPNNATINRPTTPSNNNNSRPNTNAGGPNNNNNRPGNQGAMRPTPPNNNNNRPGNPGFSRPNGNRPGNFGYRPNQRPSRPYRPVFTPIRPSRPSSWRPYASAPILNSILGLAFGSSINICINTLRNNGYYIDGYSGNEIYLRDVYEMNYSWDDGVVNYDSNGGMQSMRLYQSTYGYDSSRYDNLYSQICSQYGLPALQDYNNGEKTVTWYDRDGSHYVSLSYTYMTSSGGYPRYYTILSYGY